MKTSWNNNLSWTLFTSFLSTITAAGWCQMRSGIFCHLKPTMDASSTKQADWKNIQVFLLYLSRCRLENWNITPAEYDDVSQEHIWRNVVVHHCLVFPLPVYWSILVSSSCYVLFPALFFSLHVLDSPLFWLIVFGSGFTGSFSVSVHSGHLQAFIIKIKTCRQLVLWFSVFGSSSLPDIRVSGYGDSSHISVCSLITPMPPIKRPRP